MTELERMDREVVARQRIADASNALTLLNNADNAISGAVLAAYHLDLDVAAAAATAAIHVLRDTVEKARERDRTMVSAKKDGQ